jgi:hypothetical protein
MFSVAANDYQMATLLSGDRRKDRESIVAALPLQLGPDERRNA